MANELKTSVVIKTTKAEKSLDKLLRKINKINSAVSASNGSQAKINTKLNQIVASTNKANTAQKKYNSSASKGGSAIKKNADLTDVWASKLRAVASAYLGIQAAQLAINTSDTITSAENRLNYNTATNLGSEGYTASGDYSSATLKQTQETMDKIYSSAMNARVAYTDMISNVSKSITLASDSFGNNVDMAIKFQEIMGQAYTLGGASAAEQSSSMYQMIQALGSGILQGDELRSVREGAPLAYKAIEEFAQGIYGADKNLKDLASDGKITSDIVVAAVMNMNEEVSTAFANTNMTFEQGWTKVKNSAVKGFEEISNKLNQAFNSDRGQKMINGIITAINQLFSVINTTIDILSPIFGWIVDNWYWLKWIALSVVSAIIIALGILAAKSVWAALLSAKAWLAANASFLPWLLLIGLLVAGLALIARQTETTCDFIVQAGLFVCVAIIAYIIAVMIASWIATGGITLAASTIALFIIAIVILLGVIFIKFAGEIMGGIYAIGQVFKNVWAWIKNISLALWESIKAICFNISAAFTNAWNGAKSDFWNFVASVLEGVKFLEPAINAIAKAFGKEGFTLSDTIANVQAKANATSEKVEYRDISDAWNSKINSNEYGSISDAYDTGYAKGEAIQAKVNEWGNNLKDKLSLDGATEFDTSALGVDTSTLDGIAADTSNISDSVDLTEEDLAYLRDLAEMEWKKEFTTANITVDMSNYNTISGDNDLDGLVTKLTDKLYEELDVVANGVYA